MSVVILKILGKDLILNIKSDVIGFKIKGDDIQYPFRYRLIKTNNIISAMTKNIFYHSLVDVKVKEKQVKYIVYNGLEHSHPLNYVITKLSKINLDTIIKITIFYNANKIEFMDLFKIINEYKFPVDLLPVSSKVEPLIFEILYIDDTKVMYEKKNNLKYSYIEFNTHTEYFISKEVTLGYNQEQKCDKVLSVVTKDYEEIMDLVDKELEIKSENIIRVWNYISNIYHENHNTDNNSNRQCYQEFNRARAGVYDNFNFNAGYPCATGVGITSENELISFHTSLFAIKIKNPYKDTFIIKNLNSDSLSQAYNYTEKVLRGKNNQKLQVPLFERAKKITNNLGMSQYIISGTAGIRGEDTKITHSNKKSVILEQLKIIVEHLDEMLKDRESNDKDMAFNNLSYARIYYTREKDITLIKNYLEPIVNFIPHAYILIELCREDLFVEIECAKF